MSQSLHVTDYLWEPARHPAKPVCVLFGKNKELFKGKEVTYQPYLKQLALQQIRDQTVSQEDAEYSLRRFDGSNKSLNFSTVLEEILTTVMFGDGKRLAVIESADKFITSHREPLEKYCEKPSKNGVLVLLPLDFPATTKLFKKVAETGLLIDCSSLGETKVSSWIVRWAKQRHGITVDKEAAELLVSLVGNEHGLLDQELAKLALMVSEKKKVDTAMVESAVEPWGAQTIFTALDLALSGQTVEAFKLLDSLLQAGFAPSGIFERISSTLSKLGLATQLILQTERLGKKIEVARALEQVGVKKGYLLIQAEKQLRQLGRFRGAKLNELVLQAAMDFRGESRMDKRLILEKFLFVLSDPKLRNGL